MNALADEQKKRTRESNNRHKRPNTVTPEKELASYNLGNRGTGDLTSGSEALRL